VEVEEFIFFDWGVREMLVFFSIVVDFDAVFYFTKRCFTRSDSAKRERLGRERVPRSRED
jgi:hypothetical protein